VRRVQDSSGLPQFSERRKVSHRCGWAQDRRTPSCDGVAHDLKSPVIWIRGRLEVAVSSEENISWREPVAEAIEGLNRMSFLLNTMLDLTEAAGSALQMERTGIDLSGLWTQMLDLCQPVLAERRHELIVNL